MKHILYVFCAFTLIANTALASPVRIKDLVDFDGVRGNDLVGYGLVVGLDGSGDGLRNAPFTEDIMTNILERLGVNVTGEEFRPKNVAAVLVTATLPPFARAGGQIDVTVSAIGDAKSLMGGTLVMTPLNAADGEIYAVSQGTIIAGGATAAGDGGQVTQGVPTSRVIPSGARVEREISFELDSLDDLRLALRDADFTTAVRIENAINRDFGRAVAIMLDSGTVQLNVPATQMRSVAHAIGRIENIRVEPERKARVVVDQRSGTIVMGDTQWTGRDENGAPLGNGFYKFDVESSARGEVISTLPASTFARITEARSLDGAPSLVLQGGTEILAASLTGLRAPT